MITEINLDFIKLTDSQSKIKNNTIVFYDSAKRGVNQFKKLDIFFPKKYNFNKDSLEPVLLENSNKVILEKINANRFKSLSKQALKLISESDVIDFVLLGEVDNSKYLVSTIATTVAPLFTLKTTQATNKNKVVSLVGFNEESYKLGVALAKAQIFAQRLVNLPSNVLTPYNYVKYVKKFIKKNGLNKLLKVTAYKTKDIEKFNMGSFLGVAQGSVNKPVLLVLEYKPNKNKPLVFVGKGLTFDSGGISIKPSMGMDAMKGDMAGSAATISSVIYAALTQSSSSVVSITPICENMPSHKSIKPGDVLFASNGLSIEVLDTDAEGRLVLADALHFAKKFKPKLTIDVATLTGACVVALGSLHSGLFTRNNNLAEKIYNYSLNSNDPVWRLPLVDEHVDFLESKIADVSNLCLGKGAGASNGAVFLEKFAPKNNWVHLDVAGTATPKGVLASGRPVPLLSEIIDNYS